MKMPILSKALRPLLIGVLAGPTLALSLAVLVPAAGAGSPLGFLAQPALANKYCYYPGTDTMNYSVPGSTASTSITIGYSGFVCSGGPTSTSYKYVYAFGSNTSSNFNSGSYQGTYWYLGQIDAKSYSQLPVFEAAVQFARTEGILPAPESAHAIRAAVDEALAAREEGRPKVILFCLSGHGHFDLASYESYLSGKLQDYEYPGRDIEKAMAEL